MKVLKMVAALSVLAAASASAEVTFDPATGTGFVGKGDVQLKFGWNNAALQNNASGLGFEYSVTDAYTATCVWVTEGNKGAKTHEVEHKRKMKVNGAIAYSPRQANQITGFNLNGFAGGTPTSTGTLPVDGEPCPGNAGHEGLWTDVSKLGSFGGLYVTHGSHTHLLD